MERPDMNSFGHALEWAMHGDSYAYLRLINLAADMQTYVYAIEKKLEDQTKLLNDIHAKIHESTKESISG